MISDRKPIFHTEIALEFRTPWSNNFSEFEIEENSMVSQGILILYQLLSIFILASLALRSSVLKFYNSYQSKILENITTEFWEAVTSSSWALSICKCVP